MLKHGNAKLGPGIYTWSISSGLKEICIGATDLCLSVCYALRFHFKRTTALKCHQENYQKSLHADFTTNMSAIIRFFMASVIRIHVGGDFYSKLYVHKWIDIVKRNPNVVFYAYTRSWRDPEVYPALCELGTLKNMHLWFSTDKETGPAPKPERVRICYLQLEPNDLPKWEVDLVFRERPKFIAKWVAGSLVCPAENGVTHVSCTKCKLCFTDRTIPKKKQKYQGKNARTREALERLGITMRE